MAYSTSASMFALNLQCPKLSNHSPSVCFSHNNNNPLWSSMFTPKSQTLTSSKKHLTTTAFFWNTNKSKPHTCADSSPSKVQEFYVYEINEKDRGGPSYLRLSGKEVNSLGDLVPYTNKLYSGDLQTRLGITTGLLIFVQHDSEKEGDRYEAVYSLHLGDYGHLSVQGPYLTYENTWLTVTGGTGVFEGAYGKVELHNLAFPIKFFYKFYLKGIKDLPKELVVKHVPPTRAAEPSPAAKACEPHAVAPNFTN